MIAVLVMVLLATVGLFWLWAMQREKAWETRWKALRTVVSEQKDQLPEELRDELRPNYADAHNRAIRGVVAAMDALYPEGKS